MGKDLRKSGQRNMFIMVIQRYNLFSFVLMITLQVLQYGNSVRSRGTSGVNPDSSRSHAVLQMEIRHVDEDKLGKWVFTQALCCREVQLQSSEIHKMRISVNSSSV